MTFSPRNGRESSQFSEFPELFDLQNLTNVIVSLPFSEWRCTVKAAV